MPEWVCMYVVPESKLIGFGFGGNGKMLLFLGELVLFSLYLLPASATVSVFVGQVYLVNCLGVYFLSINLIVSALQSRFHSREKHTSLRNQHHSNHFAVSSQSHLFHALQFSFPTKFDWDKCQNIIFPLEWSFRRLNTPIRIKRGGLASIISRRKQIDPARWGKTPSYRAQRYKHNKKYFLLSLERDNTDGQRWKKKKKSEVCFQTVRLCRRFAAFNPPAPAAGAVSGGESHFRSQILRWHIFPRLPANTFGRLRKQLT